MIQIMRLLLHGANFALARPPRFVVLATPRAGTAYAARYLTEIGIRCSHEAYFTPEGPLLRNRNRRFDTRGEVSWMAVPFASELRTPLLHQVREPIATVRSLVKTGHFEPRLRERYRRYSRFIEQHFTPSDDPVDSAIRFYIAWNESAERHAQLRYRIEDIEAALPAILEVIGERPRREHATVPNDFNTRPSVLQDAEDEGLDERIRAHGRSGELREIGRRYGYAG